MQAHQVSDTQFQRLLDAIAICETLKQDNRVAFKANEAAGALSKLFDACVDFSNEAEMTPPF